MYSAKEMKILFNSYEEIPKNIGRNIIIHNKNSNFNQLFEIVPPYLITFENSTSRKNLMQFSYLTPISTSEVVVEFDPDNVSFPMHSHSMAELVFILSGEMRNKINDEVYTYSAGELCVLSKNIRHTEDFSSDFCALFIDLSQYCYEKIIKNDFFFTESRNRIYNKRNIYDLFISDAESNNSNKIIHYKPIVDMEVLQQKVYPLINDILYETIMKSPGFIIITMGLFIRLFSIFEDTNLYEQNEFTISLSSHDELFRETSNLLELSHGKISRKELEDKLNYNSEYINRIVKKYTGMNITNYSRIFLLSEARRLIETSNMNISEIVDELGFSNRNHFNKLFKDKYEVTPTEYRSMNTNSKSDTSMLVKKLSDRLKDKKNFSWEDLIYKA